MADWAVQDAKARFSELLRAAEIEPQVITYRGKRKFELRVTEGPGLSKKKKTHEPPAWWLNAPKISDFKLTPRKRERPRKVF